jgi:hypothetical protein
VQPMMAMSLLSSNGSEGLKVGKMKATHHDSNFIILSEGCKIEKKGPKRKCVVECPLIPQKLHPSQSEQLSELRLAATISILKAHSLDLNHYSKTPNLMISPSSHTDHQSSHPLLPPVQSKLSLFPQCRHGNPCMSSPHLFPNHLLLPQILS